MKPRALCTSDHVGVGDLRKKSQGHGSVSDRFQIYVHVYYAKNAVYALMRGTGTQLRQRTQHMSLTLHLYDRQYSLISSRVVLCIWPALRGYHSITRIFSCSGRPSCSAAFASDNRSSANSSGTPPVRVAAYCSSSAFCFPSESYLGPACCPSESYFPPRCLFPSDACSSWKRALCAASLSSSVTSPLLSISRRSSQSSSVYPLPFVSMVNFSLRPYS